MILRKRALLSALALVLLLTGALVGSRTNPVKPVVEMYDMVIVTGSQKPVFYVKTDRKALALTFDISWGENSPDRVLKALHDLNLKATFFLSGPWAKHYKDIVGRIVADGHEIASHGQDHDNLSQVSKEGIAKNIKSAHDILVNLTNVSPKFFRPPNGDYDDTVVLTARELGYETVIWAVDSRDWMNPGVTSIVEHVSKNCFPGAIILFHASDSARETYEALPLVVENLKTAGYELMTLGELLALGKPARDDPRGRPISEIMGQ